LAAGGRLQEVEGEEQAKTTKNPEGEERSTSEQPAGELNTDEKERDEKSVSKGENGTVAAAAASQPGDVFIEPIDVKLLNLTNDNDCNSEDLRKIINQNMNDDLNASKRVIQLASEAKFGGRFDVICSHFDFSYITNTELWCQETKETVSCYAYRQLGY